MGVVFILLAFCVGMCGCSAISLKECAVFTGRNFDKLRS